MTRSGATLSTLALAVSLGAIVACAPSPPPGTVYAVREPPPARTEVIVTRPGADYAWIAGRWRWTGADYDWVPGRWVPLERGRREWVAGHWAHARRGGWYWVEGKWR